MIAREIGSRALIVSMPPMLAYQGVRMLGWVLGDVINTGDEVRGIMQGGSTWTCRRSVRPSSAIGCARTAER